MAAALYRPAITPLPAPAVTAFRLPLRAVARQYDNSSAVITTATTASSTASLSPGCENFNGFQTCRLEGQFGSCVASTSTSYCSCNSGLQYLDCVSAAIATSSCLGIVGDWNDYQRFWIQSACPTPPSSVMEAIPQPTTVQLDYESVSTITLDGPITPAPIPVPTVTYSQGASLLSGDCASTSFSMVQGASMVYYVPFVGCNNDRPECCPFNVSTASPSADAGRLAQDRAAVVPGQFPMPKEGGFVTLSRCPQDFYSVSGMCCPNGYFQFTAEVASRTPCFSSLVAKATPPAITAGDPSNPSQSNLPTSAIINVVWALGYSVSASLSSSSSGLSTGAKVGIGIGAALGATALATLGALVLFRRRKRRKSRQQSVLQIDSAIGMTAYKPGYHAPPPGSPPPVSSTIIPSTGPGYGSAPQQQKYSDYPHQGGWQQQQLGQQEQQWASQGPSQGGYQRD